MVMGHLVVCIRRAFHPGSIPSLGALGSPEFFQNFYMHIAHHRSWEFIHGLIWRGRFCG